MTAQTASPTRRHPFAALATATEEALGELARGGLEVRPLELPDELAHRAGAGRLELEARGWAIARAGAPVAEARLVRIAGPKTEILNCMAFAARPERLPVLAAELLAFGGASHLGFLDLQTPGLEPWRQPALAARTRRLAAAFGLPAQKAPEWALESSSGGATFTRFQGEDLAPALAAAYRAYAALWISLLLEEGEAAGGEATPEGTAACRSYKEHHVASSPGTAFLGRVFGEAWTRRLQSEFLYR